MSKTKNWYLNLPMDEKQLQQIVLFPVVHPLSAVQAASDHRLAKSGIYRHQSLRFSVSFMPRTARPNPPDCGATFNGEPTSSPGAELLHRPQMDNVPLHKIFVYWSINFSGPLVPILTASGHETYPALNFSC